VPDTGDGMLAERTRAVFADEQLAGGKADALHKHFAALRAESVLRGMAGDVADVDVMQALGVSNRFCPFQCRHRRDGQVLQQIFGMKLREVEGDIGTEIGLDPCGKTAEAGLIVVQRGYDEVDDLGPLAHLAQSDERFEHGLQLAGDHLGVVGLAVGLEVDLDCVHLAVGLLERVVLHVAVGDDDAAHARCVSGIGGVHQIFGEDDRLRVGVGDSGAAILPGNGGCLVRGNVLSGNLFGPRLRDVPVLAELAVDVAAGRGDGEGGCAGR